MATKLLWKYENRLVIILSLGGAVAALDAQALFYLSPFVASDLALNNAQIGLVATIVLLTWAVSGFVIGSLSDRSGSRKTFLVGSLLMFAVCSVLSGLASSFLVLVLARALMGVAEGPLIPVTQSIMMAESSPNRRGLNMGIVQNLGAQLVGSMLGPVIVVSIATAMHWKAAFFASAIPGLLVAALVFTFVREPANDVVPQPAGRLPSPLHQFTRLWRIRNIRVCIFVSCAFVAWYFLLLTFLPLYCVRTLSLSAAAMSWVLGSAGAAGVVSSVIVPYVSDRIGRVRTIAFFASIGALAVLAPIIAGGSYPTLVGLVFFGGLSTGIAPLFMATVPLESVASKDTAAASGLIIGVGQIVGGFLGPTVGGLLADRWGLIVPLYMAAAAAGMAGLISLRLTETAPARVKVPLHMLA